LPREKKSGGRGPPTWEGKRRKGNPAGFLLCRRKTAWNELGGRKKKKRPESGDGPLQEKKKDHIRPYYSRKETVPGRKGSRNRRRRAEQDPDGTEWSPVSKKNPSQ